MRHLIANTLLSLKHLSLGVWVIGGLFVFSGAVLIFADDQKSDALQMWVFSPEHALMYRPIVDDKNAQHLEANEGEYQNGIELSTLSIAAIRSRMMSGFFSGLPTADLIEVERSTVGQVFMGPAESIGFSDLTDRLIAEGLYDQINGPSMSPWSVDGRVYGLPHDVHPVLLAYRADITEAAGIDLTQAKTWDQFFKMLRPLMQDHDGDGAIDHTPLSMWVTQQDNIELLLLQGGGELFDRFGMPTLNIEKNAELLAEIVSWCSGEQPVAVDVEEFSAGGHQDRVDGKAIAYLCPDWMCSIWKMHVPGIAGKMKVMPLPAFVEGGRRTSVRGGTMLGIPRSTQHFEQAWEIAVELYTSKEVARELYSTVDIISPIQSLWDDPVYAEPDPFFMNQQKGVMFIEQAPFIPERTSSPYNFNAVLELRDAATNLKTWVDDQSTEVSQEQLVEQAMVELTEAQVAIERQMHRNVFASDRGGDGQ